MIENRERVTKVCQTSPGYVATNERDHGKCSIFSKYLDSGYHVLFSNNTFSQNSNPSVTLQEIWNYM